MATSHQPHDTTGNGAREQYAQSGEPVRRAGQAQ